MSAWRRPLTSNSRAIWHQINRKSSISSRNFGSLPQRSAQFAVWNDQDVNFFRKLLRPDHVVTSPEDVAPFTIDWMQKYKAQGKKQMVLKPQTTEQVAAILKHCNERKLAVVPQGGNTGLVGGSVPVHDEIVLALGGLNKVLSFDHVSGILVCEAGCILESLDDFVGAKGYMMPLDLGAKGSCQVGGNLATNAGGLRLIRYGSLHGSVLGVEAVLADGTIVDCLSTMRKDNTGYDLKQLFIGSEGTLGVITKVAILTPMRSTSVNVTMLGLESFDAVQETLVQAKQQLGEVLSAVEFFDRASLDMVLHQQPQTKDPLETNCPFYMLIETAGSNGEHDMAKLEQFLENVMEAGQVMDGTVAQDAAQAKKLFLIREDIPVAITQTGRVYKYDVSLPIDKYYDIVVETRERLAPLGAQVIGYGHVGDCNLHLNACSAMPDEKVTEALEPFVFEWTSKHRGSISAEHGMGLQKPPFLHLSKSNEAIALMQQLKSMMDPHGILNPYKVLPPCN